MTDLKASLMPKSDKKIFSMVKESASAKNERMRFLQDMENDDFHDKF